MSSVTFLGTGKEFWSQAKTTLPEGSDALEKIKTVLFVEGETWRTDFKVGEAFIKYTSSSPIAFSIKLLDVSKLVFDAKAAPWRSQLQQFIMKDLIELGQKDNTAKEAALLLSSHVASVILKEVGITFGREYVPVDKLFEKDGFNAYCKVLDRQREWESPDVTSCRKKLKKLYLGTVESQPDKAIRHLWQYVESFSPPKANDPDLPQLLDKLPNEMKDRIEMDSIEGSILKIYHEVCAFEERINELKETPVMFEREHVEGMIEVLKMPTILTSRKDYLEAALDEMPSDVASEWTYKLNAPCTGSELFKEGTWKALEVVMKLERLWFGIEEPLKERLESLEAEFNKSEGPKQLGYLCQMVTTYRGRAHPSEVRRDVLKRCYPKLSVEYKTKIEELSKMKPNGDDEDPFFNSHAVARATLRVHMEAAYTT